MTILSKYILREHLKILCLCLGILFTVYLAIQFFERIAGFIQYGASLRMILLYFGLRSPGIIFDVMPIAILLATLITLGILSRHHEIIAMQSSGVSLLSITAPLLAVSFGLSLILGTVHLSLIPAMKERADYVRAVKIKKRSEQSFYGQSRVWIRDGRHTFANILFIDPIHDSLNNVSLYRLRDDFTLEQAIQTDRIQYEGDRWIMYGARIRSFSPEGEISERTVDREPIVLNKKPQDFKSMQLDANRMPFTQLKNYIDRVERDGYDVGRYRTDLYSKVLLPFVNFIMSFIAIPFGLMQTRSRGIARGIGISLVIASCYWIIHSVSLALGHAGLIPPVVAGGLTNLMFLAFGGYMFLGIRQ